MTGETSGAPARVPSSTSPSPGSESIAVQRSLERLRQERETFDQQKRQDHRWFQLRLVMGGTAVLVIPAVMVICVWLLADDGQSETVKTLATTALLVDVVSLAVAVWKIVLSPASLTKLEPVTAEVEPAP